MSLADQRIGILQRPEAVIDRAMVGHVVAEVDHRRPVDRRQPDGVDPERIRLATQMPEMLDDPAQIAEPVPAGIGVAERIDLIDRRRAPPLRSAHETHRTTNPPDTRRPRWLVSNGLILRPSAIWTCREALSASYAAELHSTDQIT